MKYRFVLAGAFYMWAAPALAASTAGHGAAAAPEDAGVAESGAAVEPAESRRALAAGLAALVEGPPGRDQARDAFERTTLAGSDPATASEAHFRLGVLDEEDAAPAPALVHYRASADAAPASRWARNARARMAWIDERSEGNLAPLAALQRVRLDPARLHDPGAIDALAVQAESFPPGLVRSEARMLAAEAWLKTAGRRAEALGELRTIVEDPTSGSPDAVLAERDLVEALLADKRLDDAAEEVRAHPFDPRAEEEVRRLVRRRWVRRAACAVLLSALALAVAAVTRARFLRRA